ncbi:hypothetical protein L6X11_004602 [Escherichia coli]|nr:hypothetical protein [Escherichia coli]
MWQCLSPPRAARARGHVLSAAVIAQSALQLLFVFFHATAGIELQRMVEMIKGGSRIAFTQDTGFTRT